jgi:hypothetical protein
MKKFRLFSCFLLLVFAGQCVFAQNKLVPHRITLKNGKSLSLNLPVDYEIVPAAEGLKRVRFFAKAPDGRIFVTDMYNLADNTRGAVYILDDFDSRTGKFGRVIPYLTNLKNPNSAQFYTDERGQHWFYLAETDKLTRRKFTGGETKPTDPKPETLVTFPDYGLSYKYGGWHLTRLRNAVGLKWIGQFLFATNQGADHLGLNKPDETFYALKDGADYGWASCYQSNGRIFRDAKYNRIRSCRAVPPSYGYFPAHSSAMGFDYFDEKTVDPFIKNSFLVSLHGSTNKNLAKGYRIVIMRKGEKLQDFMTGFLQGKTVVGRPCDIMRLDEKSFLFTDDHSGIIYLVRKKN